MTEDRIPKYRRQRGANGDRAFVALERRKTRVLNLQSVSLERLSATQGGDDVPRVGARRLRSPREAVGQQRLIAIQIDGVRIQSAADKRAGAEGLVIA